MMQSEKTDRRIRRTHRLLGDALIELTLRDGYDNVSIRDITEKADVAYATFFRHYKDKNDLLHETLHDLIDTLEEISGAPEEMMYEGYLIFMHVQEHADLYRVLLDSQGAHRIIENLTQHIADNLLDHCIPYLKSSLHNVPHRIVTYQIASSIISLVRWWLEADMPHEPSNMAEHYYDVIVIPYFETQERPEKVWEELS